MEVQGSTDNRKENVFKKIFTKSNIGLLYAILAAYTVHISSGAVVAWPSPVIPQMNLTSGENSLLNSLICVGLIPGQILASVGLESVGRKATLLANALVYLVTWVSLLISSDIIAIYVSRVLGGIGMGVAFPCVSLYIAEIADDSLRGPLNSLLQSFMAFGFLVEYIVGPYVSFTTLAWVSLSLPLFAGLMLYFVPESPHFLIGKNREKEARVALTFLRGSDRSMDLINKEILTIQEAILAEKTETSSHHWKVLLTTVSGRRCLILGLFLQALQMATGINSVLAYVEYVFDHASMRLSTVIVSVMVALTNIVASLPVPILVRLLGYKILFFVSAVGCGLSLGMVGIYFYLLRHDYSTAQITFLPVLGIVLYSVFFCLAVGPLAWSVSAEVCAPSVKGVYLGVTGIFAALFGFLSAEIFSFVLQDFGIDIVFLGFGIVTLGGSFVCLLIVPDTSRMSLNEIQEYLSS